MHTDKAEHSQIPICAYPIHPRLKNPDLAGLRVPITSANPRHAVPLVRAFEAVLPQPPGLGMRSVEPLGETPQHPLHELPHDSAPGRRNACEWPTPPHPTRFHAREPLPSHPQILPPPRQQPPHCKSLPAVHLKHDQKSTIHGPTPTRSAHGSFDFGAQWLACVSTPPCYTRSVTAPSVGLVAKVNGWLFFVRLFHSLFQAGLSRRFPLNPPIV